MEPKEIDFEFPRGDTAPISFNFSDTNGEGLKDFDEIYFTVKKSYQVKDYIFQKRLSRGEITNDNGKYSLILLHKDTANLNYGSYVYDIQVVSGIYYKTVCRGQLTLTNESTWITNE